MGVRRLLALALVGATPALAQQPATPAPQAPGQDTTAEQAAPRKEPAPFFLGPRGEPPEDAPAAERPPTSILIGPYLPAGSITLPDLSAEEPAPASAQPEAGGAEAAEGEIAVDRLAALDPSSIGAWSDARIPALPVTMWDGTPRAALTLLLPRLPVASALPSARALARRLLLSPARVPEGDGEGDPSPLVLRLTALARGGALDDLLALASRIPAAAMSEEIERLKADALLVRGDYAAACELARAAVGRSGAAYWLKLLALCEALDGNRAGTDFRLNLLADADESDPVFARLVELLLSEIEGSATEAAPALLEGVETLDPLLFALARLARVPIPPELVLSAPPLVLGTALELPGFSPRLRLDLALRALRLGLIDGIDFAPILAAMPFDDALLALPPAALADPAPGAESDGLEADPLLAPEDLAAAGAPERPPLPEGPELIALLFQQAVAAAEPGEKMRIMDLALDKAAAAGLRLPVAEALVVPLSALRPVPALAGHADLAVRISLAAGRSDDARTWYEAARTAAAAGNGEASAALARLWPLLLVGNGDGAVAYSDHLLELWWQGRQGLDEATRLARGDLLFALLGELGYAVPDTLRTAVLAAPARPAASPAINLWRDLILAAHQRRVGGVVLDALVGLGSEGARTRDPSFLATAVAALKAVGLERDARQLALEALIDTGF